MTPLPIQLSIRTASPRGYTLRRRLLTPRLRELRPNQTEAGKAAWYLRRGRRLGAKFRRQHPIGNGVVDLFCREPRLAIELEGGVPSQPSQRRKDAPKEEYWRGLGLRWLRVPNGWGLEDPEGFVRKVRERIGAVMDRGGPR